MKINGYEIEPWADLREANLCEADLCKANLCMANLSGANLCGANLSGADLREANLCGAYLSGANLRGADLSAANLYGANLRMANLSGADLSEANLRGADLYGANLSGANLTNAKLPDFQIPQQSDLVVYKSCEGTIVKLLIPDGTRRTACLTSNKCRAECAKVLEIEGDADSVESWTTRFPKVTYRKGEIVRPHNGFCNDIRIDCAPGIHFFMTRQEAAESGF